ncbi:hypothetical protein CTAYLR_000689 [Chrysophaeum taylorii]|uniref:Homeobox domain-containing protein n=1 Tax=Chrysophaeum taylorii TaxID=2483200 RepID=A0AAD7XJE2_9STRA|nr:hypothetical protein CTAYLR_000689 [Chrysophaeum taylorii]
MASTRRNARGRPSDRAANGIAALKAELNRRVQVLNELNAEEELCHRETMAWMADMRRPEVPEGPNIKENPYDFAHFTSVVDSIDKPEEQAEATCLHDLARSGDFVSLVDAVAAYKTACFGNDAVAINATAVREMILRSKENPAVLHLKKNAPQVEEEEREDLEAEIDLEFEQKLNLRRYYGLETSTTAASKIVAPAPERLQPPEFNDLERWTLRNAHHPYPTTQEKEQLAEVLNLSIGQVQHWFSNMRKRKYFPVIDLRRPPRDDFEVHLLSTYKATKASPS